MMDCDKNQQIKAPRGKNSLLYAVSENPGNIIRIGRDTNSHLSQAKYA